MSRLGAEIRQWLIAFGKVLVFPGRQTFVELGAEADGKWAGLVAWLVALAITLFALVNLALPGGLLPSTLFVLVIFVPLAILIWATLIHLGYQRFFGRKTSKHAESLYVLGAITVATLVTGVAVAQLPAIGSYLSYGVSLYGVVLTVLAIRAITGLDATRSIVVLFFSNIGTAIVVALLVLLLIGLTSTNSHLFGP